MPASLRWYHRYQNRRCSSTKPIFRRIDLFSVTSVHSAWYQWYHFWHQSVNMWYQWYQIWHQKRDFGTSGTTLGIRTGTTGAKMDDTSVTFGTRYSSGIKKWYHGANLQDDVDVLFGTRSGTKHI